METKELKELLDSLGRDWKQFKADNDQRFDNLAKDLGVAEIEEKLEKINTAMTDAIKERDRAEQEAKVLQERLDQLEATIDGIDFTSGKTVRKDLKEYEEIFDAYLRSFVQFGGKQGDPEILRKLFDLGQTIPEIKAFDTTVPAAGGVAVPKVIARDINDQVRLVSPIRDMVKLVQIGTSDYRELLNIHGENSGWAGETDTRNETNTPQFRERIPTMGTLYAYPRSTEEALQDVFFNIPQMIVQVTGDEFAIQEESTMLNGSGTNRPTGIFNTAPTTESDTASPARGANAIQYVPLSTSSPAAIDPDQLITMLYLLRRPYRSGAQWAMNSVVQGEIRKIKDGQGRYQWAPGLAPGQPDRLLGFPVRTLEGMADLTANQFPILFGNFRRGYLLVIRAGLRITVDDNITQPGYVKWYIRQRTGGILLDNNALKAGRFANS